MAETPSSRGPGPSSSPTAWPPRRPGRRRQETQRPRCIIMMMSLGLPDRWCGAPQSDSDSASEWQDRESRPVRRSHGLGVPSPAAAAGLSHPNRRFRQAANDFPVPRQPEAVVRRQRPGRAGPRQPRQEV